MTLLNQSRKKCVFLHLGLSFIQSYNNHHAGKDGVEGGYNHIFIQAFCGGRFDFVKMCHKCTTPARCHCHVVRRITRDRKLIHTGNPSLVFPSKRNSNCSRMLNTVTVKLSFRNNSVQ